MKRQASTILLIILLCVSLIIPVFAVEQPSAWANEQVRFAISADLVPTALQSKYTSPITRSEFCLLAVTLYENITEEDISVQKTFADTSDINVQKMAGLGVVNGVSATEFAPNAMLTREQAAVVLANLAAAAGTPLKEDAATFADNSLISAWALKQVGQVQAAGIMGGVGNNEFNPRGSYTREQSILTMLRLYENYNPVDALPGAANSEPSSGLTEQEVYEITIAFKEQYPHGMPWGNEKTYRWKGGIFSSGSGCAAFSFMLSDAAFGDLPARKHMDIRDIKVGDMIRVNNDTHLVTVLIIDSKKITVTEGNYGSAIHWGRTITWAELEDTYDYILTRYAQ